MMLNRTLWKLLTRGVLFHLDAEKVHNSGMLFAKRNSLNSLDRAQYTHSRLSNLAAKSGIDLKTSLGSADKHKALIWNHPFGLAAGLDKNGDAPCYWGALGFAALEIGTITPIAQPGNPKPRLFRIPQEKAIINRMGFNNDGMEAVAERLEKDFARFGFSYLSEHPFSLGINIGKNKEVPLEDAYKDYLALSEKFIHLADYFTVNISSPNTPGLRDLQDEKKLRNLISKLQYHGFTEQKPFFLKLAPDLDAQALIAAGEIAKENKFQGLIVANTTIQREGFLQNPGHRSASQSGGLSGTPLRRLTPDLVRQVHKAMPDFPIIGVGGIQKFADAREYFRAGASAVQIYTGFIYEGPGMPAQLVRELIEEMKHLSCATFPQYLEQIRK